MKVILYMAMTVNGFIAKTDDGTEWSSEEWGSYLEKVRETGNLITGRKTYFLYDDSNFSEMGDPLVVVLTTDMSKQNLEKVKYVSSAKDALKILEEKGFKTALVAGGSRTNTSFIKEDLVDEIYLDIEPIVYGDGIPLFSKNEKKLNLEFIESKMLNTNTIQLHYKVIK